MQGWIRLHRELLEKPIWQCSKHEHRSVLITILLLANHKERDWFFEGKKYSCKPGQFVTSLKSLAQKSGASIQNVRTALENFEKVYEFLTNQSTNKNRLVTVVNWELYQSHEEELTNKVTSNSQATNKQLTTNKNDKNDKNIIYDDFFESVWLEYPRKENKRSVKLEHKKKMFLVGKENIVQAITNYLSTQQNPQYYFSGGRFFSIEYENYLPDKFQSKPEESNPLFAGIKVVGIND
jgi:nitrogen regulatory protein PII-like uncharacterized protein